MGRLRRSQLALWSGPHLRAARVARYARSGFSFVRPVLRTVTSVCCLSAALQLYAKCEAVLNLSAHTGWLNGITDRHPGEVLAQAFFPVRLGAWLLDARSKALVQGHETAHTTGQGLWVL